MTDSEACLILAVSPNTGPEDLLEAYEEAVFEQASFFMRRVFIPKLAKARITRLERISLAASALGFEKSQKEIVVLTKAEFGSAKNHQNVLKIYNQEETQIKLGLANTLSAESAIVLFKAWIQLFKDYCVSFTSFCDSQDTNALVKITEAPIFVEYKNANDQVKKQLVRDECNRLAKFRD